MKFQILIFIHNYIVDFVDKKQKILYEIKPDSEKDKKLNQVKREFVLEWCKKNNFSYIIIGDEWFKKNFKNHKNLIFKQKDSKNLLKKLKQFE
jgi:very-short-patch-repair endonuclease